MFVAPEVDGMNASCCCSWEHSQLDNDERIWNSFASDSRKMLTYLPLSPSIFPNIHPMIFQRFQIEKTDNGGPGVK